MTGFEISVLCTLIATCGGVVIGVMKIIGGQTNTRNALAAADRKKASDPPSRVDHGPCNEAVDRLTDALHEEIREQQKFRKLFEVWMARQEGYARGLAAVNRGTGEFPVAG